MMKKLLVILCLLAFTGVSAQISQTFKNVTINDTLKTASDSILLIKGHLVPTDDSSLDIGTALLRWNVLYVDTLNAVVISRPVYEQDAVIFSDGTGALSSDSNLINVIGGNLNVGNYGVGTGVDFTWIGFGSIGVNTIQSQGVGEIDMVDSVDFNSNAVFSGNTRTTGITQLGQTPQSRNGTDSILMKSSVGQIMVLPWKQGRYLPNDSASSNVASFFYDSASYTLQGDYVTVWGTMTVDPTTTATPTFWYQSLPIVPTMTQIYDISGTFVGHFINEPGAIFLGSSTARAEFYFTPTNTADRYISYSFTYKYR